MSHEELNVDFLGHSTGWMFFHGGDTEIEHRSQGQPAEATGNIPAIFPHCQAPIDLHTSMAENPVLNLTCNPPLRPRLLRRFLPDNKQTGRLRKGGIDVNSGSGTLKDSAFRSPVDAKRSSSNVVRS
ncbi:hypothetical protein QQF64_000373 [Cirrhinus molitorella]|uniref:Uncharacterized protein n=1 Tax=Cirrhinus molitorella TaxID=172907 RepID=A0ABR3NXG3_9TELE